MKHFKFLFCVVSKTEIVLFGFYLIKYANSISLTKSSIEQFSIHNI